MSRSLVDSISNSLKNNIFLINKVIFGGISTYLVHLQNLNETIKDKKLNIDIDY
jgi:hypothetical protein